MRADKVPEKVLPESYPLSIQLIVLRLSWLEEYEVLVFEEFARARTALSDIAVLLVKIQSKELVLQHLDTLVLVSLCFQLSLAS